MTREDIVRTIKDAIAGEGWVWKQRHGWPTGAGDKAERTWRHIINGIHSRFKNDGCIRIAGLGYFKVVEKPARKCYNPHTKEMEMLPVRRTIQFSPDAAFRLIMGCAYVQPAHRAKTTQKV